MDFAQVHLVALLANFNGFVIEKEDALLGELLLALCELGIHRRLVDGVENLLSQMLNGGPKFRLWIVLEIFRTELEVILNKLLESKHLLAQLIETFPVQEIVCGIVLHFVVLSHLVEIFLASKIDPDVHMCAVYWNFSEYIFGVILPQARVDA